MQNTAFSQDFPALIRYAKHKTEKAESQYPVDDEIDVTTWMEQPTPDFIGIAELSVRFSLNVTDVEILAFLAGLALSPEYYDAALLPIKIKDICRILSVRRNAEYQQYMERFGHYQPLCAHGLIQIDSDPDGRPDNLSAQRVTIDDRILDYIKNPSDDQTEVSDRLSLFAQRLTRQVSLETLKLPANTQNAIKQTIRVQNTPVLLTGPNEANKRDVAQAAAGLLNQHLLSIDMAGLLELPAAAFQQKWIEIVREACLYNDCIFLDLTQAPQSISGLHRRIIAQYLYKRPVWIGVSDIPAWLAEISSNWPGIVIPLPDAGQRLEIWKDSFKNDKRCPDLDLIQSVAARYELSMPQIHAAAASARQFSQINRRKKVDVSDLERACQAYASNPLGDLAERMMSASIKPEDLFLPESEQAKLDEMLLYANAHDTVFSDWGFGTLFPTGRGLSALFYGPAGTGKSMAACMIATQLGRTLYKIDCTRLSAQNDIREVQVARIFDEAGRNQHMLLFENAELLFDARPHAPNNRINPEIAAFLQHLSDFESIVILETAHENTLDDAFKRQLKFRIEFPMPDAAVRTRIYASVMPKAAPVKPNIPFELLGEYFEVSGSSIKRIVLNAAFYAYRDKCDIGLVQLTEAAVSVCRELGMLINDNLPMPLTNAIRIEKGLKPLSEEEYKRIHKPVISQDLPLMDIPEGIPVNRMSDDFDYR